MRAWPRARRAWAPDARPRSRVKRKKRREQGRGVSETASGVGGTAPVVADAAAHKARGRRAETASGRKTIRAGRGCRGRASRLVRETRSQPSRQASWRSRSSILERVFCVRETSRFQASSARRVRFRCSRRDVAPLRPARECTCRSPRRPPAARLLRASARRADGPHSPRRVRARWGVPAHRGVSSPRRFASPSPGRARDVRARFSFGVEEGFVVTVVVGFIAYIYVNFDEIVKMQAAAVEVAKQNAALEAAGKGNERRTGRRKRRRAARRSRRRIGAS